MSQNNKEHEPTTATRGNHRENGALGREDVAGPSSEGFPHTEPGMAVFIPAPSNTFYIMAQSKNTQTTKVTDPKVLRNNFNTKDDRDRIVDAFRRLPNKYHKLHTFGVYNWGRYFDVTLNDTDYHVDDYYEIKAEAQSVLRDLQAGKNVTYRGIHFLYQDGRMVAGRGKYFSADISLDNILDIILYWLAVMVYSDYELKVHRDFDKYFKYREPYEFAPTNSIEEYEERITAVVNGKSDEDYASIAEDISDEIEAMYKDICVSRLDNSYGEYTDQFYDAQVYARRLNKLFYDHPEVKEHVKPTRVLAVTTIIDYIGQWW